MSFEPRIIAFVCKWCTYAGADTAGLSRTLYPPNVRSLMLPCTGRIDFIMVMRALLQGADGVLVSGCHPGDCHYTAGNYRARRRWTLLRDLLDVLGFDLRRLEFAWISAAEGNKWASTVTEFTEKIRQLGPYDALRQVVRDRAPGPVPQVAAGAPEPDPASATPAHPGLASALREALKAGTVQGVVAWKKRGRSGKAVPMWMVDSTQVDDLVAPAGAGNLARLLSDPALPTAGPLGLVVRPLEVAALNVLVQEKQVDPSRLVLFAVDQDGGFNGSFGLDEASKALVEPLPNDRVTGFSEATLALLDDLMARTPEERWRFWSEQSARCVRCYACRGACPMCRCTQCFAEKNQPQWIPTAADGPGNLGWQVVRAFHLAGRCVGCGACQDACPAGIPLNVLGAALARSALKNFGHRAGIDHEAPPLQADFRLQDPQPFII